MREKKQISVFVIFLVLVFDVFLLKYFYLFLYVTHQVASPVLSQEVAIGERPTDNLNITDNHEDQPGVDQQPGTSSLVSHRCQDFLRHPVLSGAGAVGWPVVVGRLEGGGCPGRVPAIRGQVLFMTVFGQLQQAAWFVL